MERAGHRGWGDPGRRWSWWGKGSGWDSLRQGLNDHLKKETHAAVWILQHQAPFISCQTTVPGVFRHWEFKDFEGFFSCEL